MKPKAMAKLRQHPGLFDGDKLMAAGDLYTFDDIFTAPVHGFRDADDYYARASARPHLRRIRIPALALNALNDPFVPAASLPRPDEVGAGGHLVAAREGGHVGFPVGIGPATCGDAERSGRLAHSAHPLTRRRQAASRATAARAGFYCWSSGGAGA